MFSFSAFRYRAAMVAMVCALGASVAVAELTPQQKQFLGQIQNQLKQAEVNLKAADEAGGTADKPATGSRAKLALLRSGQAKGQVAGAKEALAKLPADDPEVKAALEQAQQMETSITALETRLTGGAAPMAPAAGGAKLDYKQEKLLKDAQFYLREVQGLSASLDKVVAEVGAAKDQNRIDHRLLVGAMETVQKAQGRKKLMDDYLAQLPKDGAGVPETADAVAKTMAGIDAAAAKLTPVHEKLQKLIDPAAYPDVTADLERINGLSAMFADPQVLESDPEAAAEIIKQAAAAKQELIKFAQKYELLAAQKTDLGKRCEGAGLNLANKYNDFGKAVVAKKAALPEQIKADMDEANKIAEQGVAEQKPLFFGPDSGIEQRLGWAKQKLVLLAAIDAEAAKPLEKAMADTAENMKQKQASLREAIITQNTLPPDRYTGDDKQAIIDAAIAAWKKTQPDAQVMTVRIPSEKWQRESMWRLQNTTWYKIDRSKLQAQVIVKHDDKLAVVRPVNLWIDHLSSDKQTAFPMDDAKDELLPQRYLLLEKVK